MGSQSGNPLFFFSLMKVLENQTILLFEPGDINELISESHLGKGSMVTYILVPKEDKDKIKDSGLIYSLISCLSFPEGKFLYY